MESGRPKGLQLGFVSFFFSHPGEANQFGERRPYGSRAHVKKKVRNFRLFHRCWPVPFLIILGSRRAHALLASEKRLLPVAIITSHIRLPQSVLRFLLSAILSKRMRPQSSCYSTSHGSWMRFVVCLSWKQASPGSRFN